METELSLIEIDGVDDSLVDHLIDEESSKPTSTTTTYTPLLDLDLDDSIIDFSCSPLQIDRSKCSANRPRIPRPEVKGKGEMQKSCFSSPNNKGITNKENHNENNVGLTSSPDSSHTMKKRKKRGGFNLRKSLAWNKAFLTEDGVLDPVELSRLSHSFSKPSVEFLSVVPEEGRASAIKGAKVRSHLQTVEEDFLSELPAKFVNEDKKAVKSMSPITITSVRENAASVVPSASRKVQLTKSPCKSLSQGGGFLRPPGPTSQKRLSNTSAISGTMKDSKLPRRTLLKPESSLVSTTSRQTVGGAKRCNQKTPAANIEKNVGLKGSLNKTKTKTAPGLSSLSSKSSALHSGKNMASKGSSSGLKLTADPVRRADIHIPTGGVGRKVAVSLPQNAHSMSENISSAQSQPTKPSGLRMPSPSIGYFGQSKTSASHSIQSLRNTQSSNVQESGIPNPRKLSHSTQIGEALAGTSRLTKGSTDTTKIGANSLSSTSKCLIPSIAASTSHPPLQSKMQLKNQQVEEKSSDCKSVYNQTNSQQEFHTIHDVESGKQEDARNNAHDEGEQIFHENQKLGMKDKSLLVHHRSSEQPQGDNNNIIDVSLKNENVSGNELGSLHVPLNSRMQVEGVMLADNMIERNHMEKVQLESLNTNMLIGDQDVFSNVKFRDDNGDSGVVTSFVHDESLRDDHHVNEISRELVEVIKPGPDGIKQIQHKDNGRLQISDSILVEHRELSEESQDNDDCGVGTSIVQVESLGFAHHVNEKCGELAAEVVKPGSFELEQIQHEENERLQMSDSILVEHRVLSQESQDNDDCGVGTSMVQVESLGFAHHVNEKCGELAAEVVKPGSFELEQIQPEENERLQMSDSILVEQRVLSEESQDNDDYGVGTSIVQVESLGFAHHVNEKCGELAEVVKPGSVELEKIQHEEDERLLMSDSILVEHQGLSEESQGNDNSGLGTSMVHVESLGFAHLVNENCGELAEVVKPGSVEVEQIQLKENEKLQMSDIILVEQQVLSEESQKDNDKSSVGTFLSTAMMHVERLGFAYHVNENGKFAEVVKPGLDEVEQIRNMENQPLHLSDGILVEQGGLSEESQEDSCNSIIGTLMAHVESLGFAHHVNEKSGELSEVVKHESNKLEQIQDMENQQLQFSDSIPAEQCGSFEETQRDNLGNNTLISESGCGIGTSDFQSLVAPVIQLNEGIAGVDNMKNNQQAGGYQLEPLDNNSSKYRDSISGTEFSDPINYPNSNYCSRIVDDVDEQANEHVKLTKTFPPSEFEKILHKGDDSLEMNGITLLLRSTSTEELQKDDHNTLVLQSRFSDDLQEDNDIGNVIYASPNIMNSGGNECKNSHILSQLEVSRQVKEGDAEDDNTIEHHPVENHESLYDTPCEYPVDHSTEGTLEFISCLEVSKQTSDAATSNIELVTSSTEKLPLSIRSSSGNTPADHIGDNRSQNYNSLDRTKSYLSPSLDIPDGEQCDSNNGVSPIKPTDSTISVKNNSLSGSNHDALTLKYHLKAVPFSDDWLAALEAAGEDILTMKTGAVQNSPTDKSLPEPSPWSPVKRKNQEIGPFDCTKCTNLPPPNLP